MMGTKESHERTVLEGFPLVAQRLHMPDGVTIRALLDEVYRDDAPAYYDLREALSFLCGLKPTQAPTEEQVETAFANWTEEAPRRMARAGTLWTIRVRA
jgi:hypothetical protein